MNIKTYLLSFRPHFAQTSFAEKLRSGLAGGIGILLLALGLHYLPHATYPLVMLGSMAASAVLLFAVPHSPMAQPWNLVGGHLISALAGWICILFIPDQALAAGAAVGSAILLMQLLGCLHPPGAATALTLVLSRAQFYEMGWEWTFTIVAVNAGISLLLALAFNNLLPGRSYPMHPLHAQEPPKPAPYISLEQSDLEWALKQVGSVIDVSEEDLAEIYKLALQRAQTRIDDTHP